MEGLLIIIRVVATLAIALIVGKLVTKLRLPAILGWLITGIAFGPYAFNLLSSDVLNNSVYNSLTGFLECMLGLFFAKELIFKNMKSYGKQVITITLFESIGTFIVVSLCFGVIFYFMEVPIYIALLFGGIALATAPAPALAIVKEYNTKGPLTKTIVPLAMLDDLVAFGVFFFVNSLVLSIGTGAELSFGYVIFVSLGMPIILGVIMGFLVTPIYKKNLPKKAILPVTLLIVLVTICIANALETYVFVGVSMSLMMTGMAVFTTVANKIEYEKMENISKKCGPFVGVGLMLMILNLSATLDYRLITSAGILTAVYIVARGLGKYFSAYLGGKASKAEKSVTKYLGLTLLPHSGVSLVFTGMAVASLVTFDTESAVLIQGTIAAAAIINEIIAVILAKKGFECAGELDGGKEVTEE